MSAGAGKAAVAGRESAGIIIQPCRRTVAMQRRTLIAGSAAAPAAAAASRALPMTTPMTIEPIAPTDPAYAQASLVTGATRWLYVSGQVPADADGHVPADYPSQYRLAWRNVETQLRAAGMDFDNLVKVTIFLSDRALIAQSAGLRQAVLGDRSPALTIVIAGIYDSAWLLEIEAVAAA
jgi:2-iminobutanoate/2-iminopropanoate deaminase